MSIQRARAALPVLFGGATYASKVLGYSPIAYWPLTETSGTTADNAEGTAARDGTYSGVTLDSTDGPAGGRVGLWDGTNDYCDIYSASLNTAFDGSEGTVMAWIKVSGSSVWTSGSIGYITRVEADGNNYVRIFKSATNNTLSLWYKATNFENVDHNLGASPSVDWLHLALTWSETGDEAIAYLGGAQVGATQTGLGTWSGALSSASILIGAADKVPNSVFDGYIAHVAIFDTPLSADAIADLATV